MAVFLPQTDNALAGILDLLLVVLFIYLILWLAVKVLPITFTTQPYVAK